MMEFGLTPQLPYSVQEAVNRLRINISFTGSDMRKIMLVSSEPNEGKSFIAINLWNQMAEAGEKTVFLDADMRNSTVVNKYRLKRLDGKEITEFPVTKDLKRCKPVYRTFKGWKCDIRGIRKFEDLPREAQDYVNFIESQIGYPITMVSNGPGRSDIIYRESAL